MADSSPAGANDVDDRIIEEFRANEGRVDRLLADTPKILIHHIGGRGVSFPR